MIQVQVESIEKKRNMVTIRAMHVFLTFVKRRGDNKIKLVSKCSESRNTELWVPAQVFREACRQAAAILESK